MTNSDSLKTALSKAMALCAGREYSGREIRLKLNSWGINDHDSEQIIETLKKENFINDKRYASAFVRDKFHQNKWGRIKIAALLRAKGIDDELVCYSLNGLDDDDYRESLKEILKAYRRTVRAKNMYELKGKLIRFGMSRGFESNLLYDMVDELLESN